MGRRWDEARSDAEIVVALDTHPKACERCKSMLAALAWRGSLTPDS